MKRTSLGFSLIELLVVIAIVVLVAGMALTSSREENKETQVRVAAQELAAVFRETRSRAMRTRSVHAVVFNLANAAGSSGRVLNNRSGGHWYRVLGPGVNQSFASAAKPPRFWRQTLSLSGTHDWGVPSANSENPIRHHLEAVELAWIGAAHRLPKGKVRFVALTDQDNGDVRTPGDTYAPTYPRPWFGTWDEASKRIHPWGGYDSDLAMTTQTGPQGSKHRPRVKGGRTISHSGFFYEGLDGPISGCVHPSDRLVLDDTNNDGRIYINTTAPDASDDPTKRYPLWRAGEERPLIRADWQDFMLIFLPDGSVQSSWFELRHEYAYLYAEDNNLCYDPALSTTNGDAPVPPGHFHLSEAGPFDLCNRIGRREGYPEVLSTHAEATSWVSRSGFHYITLAGDQLQDRDTYPDADAYLRDLSPCYRVGISPFGEVRIVRVRTRAKPGQLLDTTITGTDWQIKATTDLYYRNGVLTDADGDPRGKPIVDTVSTEMLRQRSWWWQ